MRLGPPVTRPSLSIPDLLRRLLAAANARQDLRSKKTPQTGGTRCTAGRITCDHPWGAVVAGAGGGVAGAVMLVVAWAVGAPQ